MLCRTQESSQKIKNDLFLPSISSSYSKEDKKKKNTKHEGGKNEPGEQNLEKNPFAV